MTSGKPHAGLSSMGNRGIACLGSALPRCNVRTYQLKLQYRSAESPSATGRDPVSGRGPASSLGRSRMAFLLFVSFFFFFFLFFKTHLL